MLFFKKNFLLIKEVPKKYELAQLKWGSLVRELVVKSSLNN